ncbi:MAG: flavodoxin family protein [Pseudomonadota bacterium]
MLSEMQERLCQGAEGRFAGLSAAIVNCTLKAAGEPSHTDTLLDVVAEIMKRGGVAVDRIRSTDYWIAPGVYPDMTEHGWDEDAWPEICHRILDADILVIGTPIWLGEMSSEARKLIERLYGHSGETNDKGQYRFYGKAGGCVVTGNEDGIKHVAMGALYALQHIGYTIPPQADCGWIGPAGSGPSYGDRLDDGTRAGFDNIFTQRNTTFMSFNLMHLAKLLKDAGDIPAIGNVRGEWDDGCKPGWPNPEHRLD